jgi:hypothetical protein
MPHVIIVLCNDRHLTLRLDKKHGCTGVKRKAGTPVAQQRADRDYSGLPASTSSLPFFRASLANCVRFELLMSAIRNVGCPLLCSGRHPGAGRYVAATVRWAVQGTRLTGFDKLRTSPAILKNDQETDRSPQG